MKPLNLAASALAKRLDPATELKGLAEIAARQAVGAQPAWDSPSIAQRLYYIWYRTLGPGRKQLRRPPVRPRRRR